MRRFTKLLLIVLFPLALALPATSILLPLDPVEIENRRLTAPEVSLGRLIDPGFYYEVLTYIRDANPMRTWLIRAGAGLDYWVFDDSPDPRVLKGTDDWLFYQPTIIEGCSAPPEDVAENLTTFVTGLEQDVQTVVVTVAPSKFRIYPEYLTRGHTELAECAEAAGERLRNLLAAAPMTHYVDEWELFEKAKADGMQPYFRTDTHFNFEGSIPWMEALIDEIDDIWDPDAVQDLGETDRDGNLMRFLGLQLAEPVREVVVDRGLSRQPVEGDARGTRRYRSTGADEVPLIRGEAMVIGDSFMALPEPSLVQYFADVTVTDWRNAETIAPFLERAPHAEVVVVEISELDVWRLFADSSLHDEYESPR